MFTAYRPQIQCKIFICVKKLVEINKIADEAPFEQNIKNHTCMVLTEYIFWFLCLNLTAKWTTNFQS